MSTILAQGEDPFSFCKRMLPFSFKKEWENLHTAIDYLEDLQSHR